MSESQLQGFDLIVAPDGRGLPAGSGTAVQGKLVFDAKCKACHGANGEGTSASTQLVGGDMQSEGNPVRTVGSYWPYATTLFDYVYRAMPFGEAQSLTPDEVYGITAFLLNANDLLEDDRELNQDNLAGIVLPNRDGFIEDTRPVTSAGEPCMKDCKETVEILFKAKRLDVTPTDVVNSN